MAWRVRFARATAASSEAGAPDHVIVAYKEAVARDPDRGEPTGLFPLGGAALVGSAYDGCITPRVAVSQPGLPAGVPLLRLDALAGPAARDGCSRGPASRPRRASPGSWATSSTSARPRARRARSVIGVATDVPCGRESDERSPVHGYLAQTTLYRARSGALVFATGTLGWEYALSPVPAGLAGRATGAGPAGGGDDAQSARAGAERRTPAAGPR